MSDEPAGRGDVETDEQRLDEGASTRADRRPSPGRTPGAAAASRARRIGGSTSRRVQPAPTAPAENGDGGRNEPPAGPTRSRRTRDESRTSATVSFTKDSEGQRADRPPAPAPPAAAAPSRRSGLRWLPALVLTLAALAMAAFFAIESHGVWWARPSSNAVRDEVLAAAKTCVVAANSYSYKDFATAERKGAACTTGPQTKRYEDAMASLRAKATKLKATQVAQVNAAGVAQISQDGGQWTLLVFGQLSVHATQTGPKGRIDPFGAVVRMDHVGGKWLMSSIEPISSQPR